MMDSYCLFFFHIGNKKVPHIIIFHRGTAGHFILNENASCSVVDLVFIIDIHNVTVSSITSQPGMAASTTPLASPSHFAHLMN